MVGRYEKTVAAGAVVVDLDGTFVVTNTFREFLKYLLTVCVGHHDYHRLLKMVLFMALRRIKVVSHAWMKRRVLLATAELCSEDIMHDFVAMLMTKVNESVRSELESLRLTGHKIYLATAAPAVYSTMLADMAEFDGVISTPMPVVDGGMVEARGETKLMWTNEMLEHDGQRLWRVYTDHSDDLPLMKAAEEVVLVNPRQATLSDLKLSGVAFRLLVTG